MILKKTLALLFGPAYLTFIALQYNAPDPLIWRDTYGVAALLSFAAAFNKENNKVLLAAIILFTLGGIYMWPAKYEGLRVGSGHIKNIEEARESLGLFLCSLSCISYLLLNSYSRHSRPVVPSAPQAKEPVS